MKVMVFWIVKLCRSEKALSEPNGITMAFFKKCFLQTNYTVKFILGIISEK